jgi:hypothetical protein
MNDQIPDFEPPPPMFEDPKPAKKPRRKPTKKKAVKTVPAKLYTARPGRTYKKRKTVKRGRPPGALGKPKIGLVVTEAAVQDLTLGHYQDVRGAFLLLKKYTPAMRARLLSELKDVLL